MIIIEEHTIEETLLTKNGWVLDLGCVNFRFSEKLLPYCNNVISIDANPNVKNSNNRIIFKNCAIVNEDIQQETITYNLYNDTNGNSLLNPKNDWCHLQNRITVKTITLSKLMKEYNIKQFDLIKMDIEGSEYSLLENMDWKIAKQFSVEFHDFRSMNPTYPNNNLYYEKLFEKMTKYCDIIKHDCTDHPGFPSGYANYWDSLFILKKEYHENS